MLALLLCIAAFGAVLWRLTRARRARSTAVAAAAGTFTFLFLGATWLISNAFTGDGFNGAVIYHLRTGFDGAGVTEYAGLMALSALLTALALGAAAGLYRRLRRAGVAGTVGSGVLMTACLWVLCLAHPTVNGTLRDFNRALYGPESLIENAFEEKSAGKPFAEYYLPPVPNPELGTARNLVVIYAESLETTYFDEELFPDLITELRGLQEQAITFDDIRQVEGTGFTIAGIVASQCGLPLITSGHPNSLRGMDRFLSGATCLGDLLKERGYTLHYLGGADLSFAGKGTFMRSHGFRSVEGFAELKRGLDDPDYKSTWGLYDDTLFDAVTDRFDTLAAAEEPFGLVSLTMDTHHPHGHPSRSCDGLLYGDGSNEMLNAVRCTDRLLAQTLRRLLSSPAAKDTLFVLASDHLALKNDAYDLLTSGRRRNLLWLFSPDAEPGAISTPGTTMDTAATIGHYLGLGTKSFALGRNLVAGDRSLLTAVPQINWQLREWRSDYTALWELPDAIEALSLDPRDMTVRINDRSFKAPALITLNDGHLDSIRFAFDAKRFPLYGYLLDEDPGSPLVWFDECRYVRAMDTSLPAHGKCFFAGKIEGRKTLTGTVEELRQLPVETLARLANSFPSRRFRETRATHLDNLAEFGVADLRRFDVAARDLHAGAKVRVSSSGGPGNRSILASEADRAPLKRGIQLFALGIDGRLERLAHIDPCGMDRNDGTVAMPSLKTWIKDDLDRHHLVVVHDSATCGEPLGPVFEGLPVKEGQELAFREPYIALLAPGLNRLIFETRGEKNTILSAVFKGPDATKLAEARPAS